MIVYVNIALTYCKLARWTPVLFCYKTGFTSIQSYLRCSSVWYPPHTRVKKSKEKSQTKYTDLAQSNSRYFTSLLFGISGFAMQLSSAPSAAAISRRSFGTHMCILVLKQNHAIHIAED